MSSFALFIEAPESTAKTPQQIQNALNKIGLPLLVCTTIDGALEALEEQAIAGKKPVLLLFGPNPENPAAAARRLRREAPLTHFVFLTNGTNVELEQQLTSPVAMVGSYWSIAALASEELTELLQAASDSARQRLSLRTTLDRINGQLPTHPRPDVSELRRYTVSDRFLVNILENARDAIITTNNSGIIITWNKAAEKMFDLSQDDAVGRSIAEVADVGWSE
jgi:PAS domain-containing protein